MFKKNKIKDVINKSDNLINGIFIVDLLDKGYLDKYMDCLSDNKIYIECPTIIKKKYLTEYEQFLCILDNFITYTINSFSNIELIYIILPLCIANDKNNIFLTKKYFYDNSNITYFNKEFNKLIIENFYNNCLVLRNELDKLFMAVGFDLDNIDKDNYNDLLKMVNLLEEICFVNRGKYGIIALFEKINDNNYNMFFMQYELLFTMYKKNGILLWNIEILRKVVYKKVNFGLLTFFWILNYFILKFFSKNKKPYFKVYIL